MATQQGDDIQELKLDVGLIKGDIKTIKRDMSQNQKTIIDRMDKFAFVTQKDHDRDVRAIKEYIDTQFKELRSEIMPTIEQAQADSVIINKGGVKAVNSIFGGVSKVIVAAVVISIFVAVILYVPKLLPAVGSQ